MERGGESEMCGKSNVETYITICKIGSQWEFAVWLRKLKQGLCINLEGCDGERVSKGRGYMSAAAAAAKSLQLCPTLCDRIDGSPLGSSVPGILQARTLEWVAISFSNA